MRVLKKVVLGGNIEKYTCPIFDPFICERYTYFDLFLNLSKKINNDLTISIAQ